VAPTMTSIVGARQQPICRYFACNTTKYARANYVVGKCPATQTPSSSFPLKIFPALIVYSSQI